VVDRATLVPATLHLLILRPVSLGKLHRYGVLLRIEQIANGDLRIKQGALTLKSEPALPER
jgi:PadR family transcriptional regulator PadR